MYGRFLDSLCNQSTPQVILQAKLNSQIGSEDAYMRCHIVLLLQTIGCNGCLDGYLQTLIRYIKKCSLGHNERKPCIDIIQRSAKSTFCMHFF